MDREQSNLTALAEKVKPEVMSLAQYIPWFTANLQKDVSGKYGAEELSNSISFPVYDANLMRFVKEASRMSLMNKNYQYVYTRNHIQGAEEELRLIERASMKEWDTLSGILSRYVLVGMRRANVWTEGTSNGVFLAVLTKMKELVLFWAEKEERA